MLKNIVIEPAKIIDEVEKRPCLYDGKSQGVDVRRASWEEVCKEVYSDLWLTADDTEKDAIVKEVQSKWKSFRDAYSRCKREQVRQIKKRKYIYFDRLQFLEINSTSGDGPSNSRSSQRLAPKTTIQDASNNIFLTVDNSDSFIQENDDSSVISGEEIHVIGDDASGAQSSPNDKIARCLKEVVNMQKESRSDDKMGNKSFLLSLLPFFEKLPDDINMEVRLQVMSIIQTYSREDSYMKM